MSDHPCTSCPWLRANQTAQAVRESPVDGRGVHWFAVSNLRSRWRFVRAGGMLPCHATDKRAPLYGGKFTAAKEGRICVGLATLAHREVRHFMECGMDPAHYRKTDGLRFSLKALAMWASMLLHHGHHIEAGGAVLLIPEPGDDARATLPWPDAVHDGQAVKAESA